MDAIKYFSKIVPRGTILGLIFILFSQLNVFSYENNSKLAIVKNIPLNIRNGFDKEYKTLFIINKLHIPVLILNKVDNWCLIKDFYNRKGWTQCSTLSITNNIHILQIKSNLYRLPKAKEKILILNRESIVKILEKCINNWCRISLINSPQITGWIEKESLWPINMRE